MTLIVTVLTPDLVLQGADFRITSDDEPVADDFQKTVLFCGNAVFTFTGRTTLESTSTLEWLSGVLAESRTLREALEGIAERAEKAVARLVGIKAADKRLAFVAAGWGEFWEAGETPEEGRLRPFVCTISNFRSETWQILAKAQPTFRLRLLTIARQGVVRVHWEGQGIGDQRADDLVNIVGEANDRGAADPAFVASLICKCIQDEARSNPNVGSAVLINSLPLRGVEYAQETGDMTTQSGITPDRIAFGYLAGDQDPLTMYSPRYVCEGAQSDFAAFGTLEEAMEFHIRTARRRKGRIP